MICGRCGQEHLTAHNHPACPGHLTSGENKGRACRNDLGYKTEHPGYGACFVHGGKTDSHNKAAAGEKLEDQARKLLKIEGYEPITDPYTQLSDIAGELVKLKDIMRNKVEELTTLKDVGGEKVATQIDVVFSAYERSLDRCERMLMGMARLDLEDRIARLHARIDDDAAKTIIAALVGALDAAEIQGSARDVIISGFGSRLQPGNLAGSRKALTV